MWLLKKVLGEAEEVDQHWAKFKVTITEAAVVRIPRINGKQNTSG